MHPAAPKDLDGWKRRFWILFQQRHQKWGKEPPTKTKFPIGTAGRAKSPGNTPARSLSRASSGGSKATPTARETKATSSQGSSPPAQPSGSARVKPSEFKMQVMIRFRPSVARPGQTLEGEEEDGAMFLPLHQRLQLERMGHDTSLEQEVHTRMTSAKGGKTRSLEEQRAEREAMDSAKPPPKPSSDAPAGEAAQPLALGTSLDGPVGGGAGTAPKHAKPTHAPTR